MVFETFLGELLRLEFTLLRSFRNGNIHTTLLGSLKWLNPTDSFFGFVINFTTLIRKDISSKLDENLNLTHPSNRCCTLEKANNIFYPEWVK